MNTYEKRGRGWGTRHWSNAPCPGFPYFQHWSAPPDPSALLSIACRERAAWGSPASVKLPIPESGKLILHHCFANTSPHSQEPQFRTPGANPRSVRRPLPAVVAPPPRPEAHSPLHRPPDRPCVPSPKPLLAAAPVPYSLSAPVRWASKSAPTALS